MEQELKLVVTDLAAWQALERHRILKGKLEPPQQLNSVYFDTPDFDLQRKGVGLRLRQAAKGRVQTLKAQGRVAGALHQRLEWEMPVEANQLEMDRIIALVDDADTARLVKRCRSRVAPRFEVKVERRVANLKIDGSRIEVALDEGEILAQRRIAVVRELELELKEGDPSALFDLAIELAQEMPLLPEPASKAQRGYELLGCSREHAEPTLKKHDTFYKVFEHVMIRCLEQVTVSARAFLAEEEAGEALHKFRVAVRRLRSALKLFDELASAPASLQEDLKWLTGALGPARDWEVLDRQTMPRIEAELRQAGAGQLDGLLQKVQDTAAENRRRALDATITPRVGALLLGLYRWTENAGKEPKLQEPARGEVLGLLTDLQGKIKRRRKRIAKGDAASLHRLRLAGKQSRYAHEFFDGFLDHKRNRRYVAKLSKMQEELGQLNDRNVARQLLTEIPEGDGESQRQFLLGYLAASSERGNVRKIRKKVKAILDLPPPRPV